MLIPVSARFMLLSALGFSLMSVSVKYVSNVGIPVFEIVAARGLVSLVISVADVKRKQIALWGNNKLLLLLRGIVGTFALICVFYVLTTLPLAEATLLQYVHPIFTVALAVFFLKERIQRSTLICILFCLLGLFVMVIPGQGNEWADNLPLFSVFIALIGAFCSSIAYVLIRKLSQTEDSSVIIFYFPLVALPVSVCLLHGEFVMPDVCTTLVLISVGIFTQIGQYGLTKAMKVQAAGKVSAYSYVQIVLATIFGILFFGEIPSLWTYIGGILIVSGALINIFGEQILRLIKV